MCGREGRFFAPPLPPPPPAAAAAPLPPPPTDARAPPRAEGTRSGSISLTLGVRELRAAAALAGLRQFRSARATARFGSRFVKLERKRQSLQLAYTYTFASHVTYPLTARTLATRVTVLTSSRRAIFRSCACASLYEDIYILRKRERDREERKRE